MFEVQTYTICDGWINCWVDWIDNDDHIPTQFKTYEEAKQELEEFFLEAVHMNINPEGYRIVRSNK